MIRDSEIEIAFWSWFFFLAWAWTGAEGHIVSQQSPSAKTHMLCGLYLNQLPVQSSYLISQPVQGHEVRLLGPASGYHRIEELNIEA